MIFHTNNHTQWRQKWEKMKGKEHTGKFFHTWHDSEEEALQFVAEYIHSLGTLSGEYYRPYEQPGEKMNTNREPKNKFLENGVITLAPL